MPHDTSSSESDAEDHPPQRSQEAEAFKYDVHAECIEIFNVRLFRFDELAMDAMDHCVELALRKNLIHYLDPLPDHLAARLEVLDLFDNKIKKIKDFFVRHTVVDEAKQEEMEGKKDKNASTPALPEAVEAVQTTMEAPLIPHKMMTVPNGAFPRLVKLDLSYNQIKHVSGLESLAPTLKELYLVENKIKTISGLEALVNLELLELGGNRIASIGNTLDKLTSLKQLWIGKNKIQSLGTSLQHLNQLELLSLQANRLTKIEPENFPDGAHPHLAELFLSENGFTEIEHLPLHRLRLLDYSMNPIPRINEDVINASNMPELEEFWLTDGKIKEWTEVEKLQPFAKTLRTVYLERNPLEEDHRYRDKVYMHLPFVTQIDSWPVVNKGNLESDRRIERRK